MAEVATNPGNLLKNPLCPAGERRNVASKSSAFRMVVDQNILTSRCHVFTKRFTSYEMGAAVSKRTGLEPVQFQDLANRESAKVALYGSSLLSVGRRTKQTQTSGGSNR